jgi:hypothetical protein
MLEPFQCIFILACALWAVGQVLPNGTIQNKLQATGGMVMMLIGVIVTGIITVPQFDDKDTPVTTYQATKASVEVEDREALSQRMREQQARYVMDELARPMPEVGRR